MANVECKLKDDLENWNTEFDVVYHNSDDIEYKTLEILIYILANNIISIVIYLIHNIY